MAALLEGVELSAVAILWVVVALLFIVEWLIIGPLKLLQKAFGWVPFAGDAIGSAKNAIQHGMDNAIDATQNAAHAVWHGAVWSFDETLSGIEYFAKRTAAAIEYLHSKEIPLLLLAGLGLPGVVAARLVQAIIDGKLTLAQVLARIGAASAAQLDALWKQTVKFVRTREAAIRKDARAWAKTAETDAVHAATTAGGAIAVDIPEWGRLGFDDLDALWRRIPLRKLAEYAGPAALLYALVHALEAETGLGRRECRDKVKGICGVNPSAWASFLQGLLALGFTYDLAEVVKVAGAVVGDAHGLLADVGDVPHAALVDAGRAIGAVAQAIAR